MDEFDRDDDDKKLPVPLNFEFDPPWGSASPRRGADYHDMATSFLDVFPIGTSLTQDQFGDWLFRSDYLSPWLEQLQRCDIPTKDDASWSAWILYRNAIRYRLNQAAAHPRMTDQGCPTFVLQRSRPQLLEVRSTQDAIVKSSIAPKVVSLITTKKRQLDHLMQSADWTAIPPHERVIAEAIYDDIDEMREQIEIKSNRITSKFSRLEDKLNKFGIQLPTVVDTEESLPPLLERMMPEADGGE